MYRLIYFVCFLLLFSCGNKKSAKSIPNEENPIQLRVGAYNVEVSRNATAMEIGEALKPYELDVVSFSEAPGGDWTARVANVLDMKHVLYRVWIEIEGCGIFSRTIGMGPACIDYGQSCIHPIIKTGIDKGLIISFKPVLDNGRIDLPVIDIIFQL